jgi:hypothetical protein
MFFYSSLFKKQVLIKQKYVFESFWNLFTVSSANRPTHLEKPVPKPIINVLSTDTVPCVFALKRSGYE